MKVTQYLVRRSSRSLGSEICNADDTLNFISNWLPRRDLFAFIYCTYLMDIKPAAGENARIQMPTSKPSAPSKVAGRGDGRGTQFYPYTIKHPEKLHFSRDHDSREDDGNFKTHSQEIVHPHPATRYQNLSTSQQPPLHWTISDTPQCEPQVAEDKPISSSRLDMIFPEKSFITKKDGCSQKEESACWRVRLYREPSGGIREEDTSDDLEDVDQPYIPGYLAENRQRCLQWLRNIPSDADCW